MWSSHGICKMLFLFLPFTACTTPPPVPAEPSQEMQSAWRTFGHSVEGRPLRVRTVGRGPRRVLWVGGIHGNEREGSFTTASLPAACLEHGLGERVTLTLIEDLNPDGSAAGVRHNRNRVDLNRNFPASNFRPSVANGRTPLDQPEARAFFDLVFSVQPELVIVAHSWRGRYFINYDGPGEGLAKAFSRLSAYPIEASENIHGTPGSLGSYFGIDLGIPVLTLEHQNGMDPQVAFERTRKGLLQVIEGTEIDL